MSDKPTYSLLLDWMTQSLALAPTSEPVAPNIVWNDGGVITLSVGIPPTITDQPDDIEVNPDDDVSFSVTATNATSYQWYRNTGAGFATISGETASTLSLSAVTIGMTTYQYRCIVTGPGGSTTSSTATLTVVLPSMPAGALGLWYADAYVSSPRIGIPNAAAGSSVTANLTTAPRRNFSRIQYYAKANVTVVDSAASAADGSNDATTVVWGSVDGLIYLDIASLPAGTYTVAVDVATTDSATVNFRMGAYTSEVTKTANGTWASFSVTFVKASTASQLVTIVRSVNSSTPANLKIINARLFSGASDLGIDALAGHMYFGATNFENQVTVASGIMSQNTSTKFGTIQFSTSKSLNSFSGFVVSRKTATDAGKHQPVLSKIGTPDFLSWSMLHCGSAVAEPSCMVTAERAYTTGGGLWQPRLNEWHLLAYRYNGTTLTFWLDGVKAISVSLSSLTQSVIDLWVGCLLSPSNTFSKYDVNAIALYDSALSDANMVLAADVLIARAANSGISIGGSRYLYCEGDSLTNGTGGSNSQGYAQLFGPNSSPGVNGSVGAISGGTLADVVSRAAATDAILPTNKRGKVFVHSLLIGANDIYNITPATYAATISSYMAARKAAGWDKTVLGTILPRGTANHNTNRNAFNAIVTAGGWAAANNVDAIADFAAQATMGPDAAYLNATYYGDGVHPTAAGYALLEPVFRSAVNGL